MELLALIFVFVLDFLLTSFCFWLITFVLSACGLAVAFTWGWAFAFWVICKILKLIF